MPARDRDQDRDRPRDRDQPGDRDRDQSGRPRNARPRDASGRPLPRGAPGVPTMPDDLAPDPPEALALAQRLIDEGRPFHAHEVLESVWKRAGEADRELWRGLAQIAVGLTHLQRGNRTGAAALLTRGADRVAGYATADRPDLTDLGLDPETLTTLTSDARTLATTLTTEVPHLRLYHP